MSTNTPPDVETTISDANFSEMLKDCGYRDMREHYGSLEFRILRASLYRPCKPGEALPPHLHRKLRGQAKKGHQMASAAACKYAKDSAGIDAYIALLRIQIHLGLTLDEFLDRQLVANPQGKACRIWHLLHHDFGENPSSDIYVKGLILFIISDMAEVDIFPHENTLKYFLFDNHFTMVLYSWHELSCVYQTNTGCKRRLPGTDGQVEEVLFNFVVEAEKDKSMLNMLTHVSWQGKESLDELYQGLMLTNLATKPPLSSDNNLREVWPLFGRPLFQTIHYTPDPTLAQGSIENMRSFTMSGKTNCEETPSGDLEWKEDTMTYHLLAIANLKMDVVRMYDSRTEPAVEFITKFGNSNVFPTNRDNGMWKVGERDGEYLLLYTQVVLGEDEEYIPPTKGAREYISPKERHDEVTAQGTTFDFEYTAESDDLDDSASHSGPAGMSDDLDDPGSNSDFTSESLALNDPASNSNSEGEGYDMQNPVSNSDFTAGSDILDDPVSDSDFTA